jgi:hypothetical protein
VSGLFNLFKYLKRGNFTLLNFSKVRISCKEAAFLLF